MSNTYSFLDTGASIIGIGGSISIGAGAGVASEGITVEMAEDKDVLTMGADGTGMHNLHASNAGNITVRLLKTSPTNQKLQAMYNVQRLSSANWGGNVITITNPATGDVVIARECAFRRQPTIVYSTDGAMNEWAFNATNIDMHLGDNVVSA